MNPIFTSAGRFADHLQSVSGAIVRVLRTGDVPELVMAAIPETRATLTPWLPGAPFTALIRWADHLTDPSWSAVVHDPITDDRLLFSLFVVGQLDGVDVELVGTSYREPPGLDCALRGRRQPVDVDALRELAAAEDPIDLTPEPAP